MDRSLDGAPHGGLSGRVALVTGGAVRIGRGIVEALAASGCRCVVHYASSEQPASELVATVRAGGGEAIAIGADLANPQGCKELFDLARERFGAVDILVNNAGIFLEGRLADVTLADWNLQMGINLRAPFLLTQAFAAQGTPGQIVNLLDARTFRPAGDHFAYRVAKAALYEMTRMAARDLAPKITVNAVALGAILPPPGAQIGYLEELVADRVPLARSGSPREVAENVLHLLTQPFLTGVILRLDGGEYL